MCIDITMISDKRTVAMLTFINNATLAPTTGTLYLNDTTAAVILAS